MSGADKSLNVLLVEDSPDDRFFFQYAFERAQTTARLFVANDGFDALDYLDNKGTFANAEKFPRPDIIFLDLKMPGCNGFDVLRWMESRSLLQSINVIILSGSHEPQDMEQSRRLGARDYVVKPIDAPQLLNLLKH